MIGAPLAVNPVTPAGIVTVTLPSAEDAVAVDVNLPEELTSPLRFVVPGGSVVVIGVVVAVVVVGVTVTVTIVCDWVVVVAAALVTRMV